MSGALRFTGKRCQRCLSVPTGPGNTSATITITALFVSRFPQSIILLYTHILIAAEQAPGSGAGGRGVILLTTLHISEWRGLFGVKYSKQTKTLMF